MTIGVALCISFLNKKTHSKKTEQIFKLLLSEINENRENRNSLKNLYFTLRHLTYYSTLPKMQVMIGITVVDLLYIGIIN